MPEIRGQTCEFPFSYDKQKCQKGFHRSDVRRSPPIVPPASIAGMMNFMPALSWHELAVVERERSLRLFWDTCSSRVFSCCLDFCGIRGKSKNSSSKQRAWSDTGCRQESLPGSFSTCRPGRVK